MPGNTHPDLDWKRIRSTWNERATTPGGIGSIREFATEFGTTYETIRRHQRLDAEDLTPWPTPLKAEKKVSTRTPRTRSESPKAAAPRLVAYDELDDVPVAEEAVEGEDPTGNRALLELNALVVRRTLRRLIRGKIALGQGQGEIGLVSQLTSLTREIVVARQALAKGEALPNPHGREDSAPRPFVVEHRRIEPLRVNVDDDGRAVAPLDERSGAPALRAV